MLLVIAMFIARMSGQFEIGQWIGLASTLAIIPLAYVFRVGLGTNRRRMYFVWVGLMIFFLLLELVVDHILSLGFRNIKWAVVPCVMFFFSAIGSMIGLAAQAGRRWAVMTSLVFLIMASLAFVQRSITGL